MGLTSWLLDIAVQVIQTVGYAGVSLMLILDNCGVPIPSEGVLALSGSLARTGSFNLLAVIIIGTVAQTIGCYLAYMIGKHGGEPLVKRYGKYLLISSHDFDKAKDWFRKKGEKAVIISRITPVIRTFIGFPAGIFGMDLRKFLIDSTIGTLIWTIIWVLIGYALGDSWHVYRQYTKYLDYIIITVLLVIVARFVYHRIGRKPEQKVKKNHA